MTAARDRRWFLLGDPQTTFARVTSLLRGHKLLDEEDRLLDEVGLVSLGDHFDYHGDPAAVGAEGERVLNWLASHSPEQVVILAGNHDLARVMEFASVDDETFAEARDCSIETLGLQGFRSRFPMIPTPELASRDYHSFTVSQRELVASLLRARRMRLAAWARRDDGAELLLTHAGVTERERAMLGVRAHAGELSRALNAHLDAAIAPWREGAALSLAPLHHAGTAGEEGGGMLYHRPSLPDASSAEAWSPERPRRFAPGALPRGLAQACGHTGHAKCRALLAGCMSDEALAVPRGGARTLSVRDGVPRYTMGLAAPEPDGATLYLLDGDLARGADTLALMELAELHAS